MAEDYTMELVTNTMKNLYSKWKDEGLSDDEIILRLTDTKLENALDQVTNTISDSCIEWLQSNMSEQVVDERARTTEFIARNELIWNKGFIASETMYLIVLEAARAYSEIISEFPEGELENRKYTYSVLKQIHGRACQQFLEILHLLKGGFADGAFARWRSLYELSVISKFIRNNGEIVAKAYFDDIFSTDYSKNYWAKAAPCFASYKGKSIPFNAIQEKCSFAGTAWKNQHALANQVVHSSPLGTFGRLCVPSTKDIIPVGRSDYGLATPAINAAISLSMISADFLITAPSGDGVVYIKTITKWSEIVRECYSEIEEKCFNKENDNTEPSADTK